MKKILLLILAIFVLLATAACAMDIIYAEPTVVSIAVSGIKKVDDYIVGDMVDISEAKLVVTYSNGKIEEVPMDYSMLDDTTFNMSVPEVDKIITVKYKGVTTSFNITVLDLNFESANLITLPHKLVYIEGENVLPEGAFIGVNYSGGKTVRVEVTNKMLQAYNNTKLGEQDILISYLGRTLSFSVSFLPKTVKTVVVTREPTQNSVFQNFGSSLKLDGMRLKLFYDNGLTPEVLATDISNSVRVYLDDSDVKTVVAKVVYLPANYYREVVYEYLGNALVDVGSHVYPDLALASNVVLEDSLSKTYGKVTSVVDNKVIVDTVVDYQVTSTALKTGQIVLDGEMLGRYGSSTVFCSGGGVVTSVAGGVVTIQTAPTSSFNINVKGRNYQSMDILTYPQTNINQTDTRTQSIIQGDTLDLKTGKVRVYFDNGEHADLTMDSTLIRVVNSADDMQRNEIANLKFNQVNDVEGLGEGRYQLLYDIEHTYGDSGITVVVSVVDEDGRDIYVQENRHVSLNLGKNYTVSIRVSRSAEGETKVSECSYFLSTLGAGVRHKQLDISAAGRHSLMVVYGGVEGNSKNFTVTVAQKTPVQLILDDTTNNISNQQFYKGETIKIDTLNYRIKYDNGDLSEWTGVTLGMLGEGCTLVCDTITTVDKPKIIFFTVIGSTHVKSPDLYCTVVPEPIVSVTFTTLPDNLFLTATAGTGNDIDLSGGVISVFYRNNRVVTIGDKPGENLSQLLNAGANRARIELNYEPIGGGEIPSTPYSPEQIYNGEAEGYTATLTYFDEEGAYQKAYLTYYIYYIPGATKSVDKITADYRVGQYKQEYIQSEGWDLEGIKLIVSYTDGTTSTVKPTIDMIYKSTTNNIGKGIPLKFSYLGKVYSGALSIDVSNRIEQSISIRTAGKNTYFTTDRSIDLSQFRFDVEYNAGPYEQILGITNFTGSLTSEGWWYQLTDLAGITTVLNREGKKIVKLHHTTRIEGNYHTVSCDIPIEVFVNNSPVVSIAYIPEKADSFYNMTHNGLPILAEVAAGWEIMFSDYDKVNNLVFKKMLTLNYLDGTVGYVDFDNTMLSYSKNDQTQGYRRITITYKGSSCDVNIFVNKSSLDAIEVYRRPLTNYIAGAELNLAGGILKLIFKGEHVTMEKYIDMDNDDVTVAGHNPNIDESIDRQTQTISLTYKEKSTAYTIVVYNKQHVVFQYQNTIFFYGRTKNASVQAFRSVPEFVLPSAGDIKMYYVSSEYFLEDWDAVLTYLSASPDRAVNNILEIIVGYDEDGIAITCYVDEIFAKVQYPYSPATRGYDYYILMTVKGNVYYKDANYAIKKYTVIPKVVLVSSINASEYAYIYRIKTDNIAATVKYLFDLNFANVRSHFSEYGFITGLEMVSPNKNYVEILLSVNTTYVENPANYQAVKDVFAYIKGLIEANVVINDKLPIEQQVNVSVSNYDTVSADGISRGVNTSEFEGGKPSFISYRIDRGETLTLGGVMDLLENSLDLNVVDGYYNIGTFRTKTGTLSHNNYNIDFVSGDYIVKRRVLSGYIFNLGMVSGTFEAGNLTLNITTSQSISLTVNYVKGLNGKTSDTISGADYKVKYYKDSVLLEERPTTAGTYQVNIIDCYANSSGNLSLNFTLVIS